MTAAAAPLMLTADVPDRPLHILLLEDSPLDAELTLAALTDAGLAYAVTRADSAESFAAGLADDRLDLVLSDFALPHYNGVAALKAAHAARPDVPFIYVSGALGEELAIQSLQDGATDYVLKQRLGRLGPAVRRAVAVATERRGRLATEAGLRQSEDRYRFLADAVPHIVWTARPDGTVDYCNARWHEFTGQSLEPAHDVGGLAAALHPDDVQGARAAWAAAVATGSPFEGEYRLRHRDASFRWHLFRGVPRADPTDPSQGVAQWVGTATDIDDRRQTEAEHRQLLEKLDAILANMNEGLAVADAAGRVLSMNAAGLRIHGFDAVADVRGGPADLIGRLEFSHCDGSPLPTHQWPLARAAAGETFADLQVCVHRPDTGRRWVGSYAGTAIRAADGHVMMAIVTFRDVTAQTQADADLADAKRDADQARDLAVAANQSKDDFLATLSHELRTPLNAILGWTQLLRADLDDANTAAVVDPDDLRQGLTTIDRNARVQAQLIEDLLDVSRIASGKLRLTRQPADLRAVVAAAADAVRPTAAAKGVHLVVDAGPAACRLACDPNRLQQVAWNLLANAIKFTPPEGTVRAAVAPLVDGTTPGLELTVTDTGQGIAPDFLPFVFDRFRQADGSAGRKHGGLGLGLAIVRHLVDLHGGTVTADSDGDGRGSTFRVWLPVGDVPPESAPAPAAGRPRLSALSVLVVDDDPDARAVTALMLRRDGASVTSVGTAAEAVAVVAADRPSVLVSDIAMPGEDGYALITAVRRLPPEAGGRTPAVAVTAYARTEDRDRILSAGFDAHVPKPLDAAALTATVAALAARR